MDILRKMFKMNEDESKKENETSTKDEFRKPQWFEESETDDELFDDRKFAVKVFTNPIELQKHFERQMQEVLKAINEYDENEVQVDKDLKGEYLKPGFEGNILKEFEKQMKMLDTDLDGEIYADQLHSLMQQFNPEQNKSIIAGNNKKSIMAPKKKLSDEEIIMGKIHGTIVDEDSRPVSRRRSQMPSIVPHTNTPFGGVFEGAYQGPKMFRQSVMTKTIRKPDGTYETTKITQDSEGNKQTTITRTKNGKSETITTYNDDNKTIDGHNAQNKLSEEPKNQITTIFSDPNIIVTKQGYAVPRNLW